MARIGTFLILLMSAGVLLLLAYPWSVYQQQFQFGAWETIASYATLALLLALTATIPMNTLNRWRLKRKGTELTTLAVGLVTSAATLILALAFSGPGLSLNIPGTRVRGIFFAEWKFATFFVHVGLPLSILSGTLWHLNSRQKKESNRK